MSRRIKVYAWYGHRRECDTQHHQTREIVAASSKAEVARIAGETSPARMFNLGETGNPEEIATAMATPGVIHWKPLDYRRGTPWTAVSK